HPAEPLPEPPPPPIEFAVEVEVEIAAAAAAAEHIAIEPVAVEKLRASEPPEDADEEPAATPESPADFWTREAFGLEIPEEGFGVADSPAAPGSPARRKRRRRRRPGGPAPSPAVP
ncbi:MAG TPA: hypothetical protein VE129_08755, partial [Thermoanaerobaculia bacterium]|nr:hypothetical protein [Thermoanaerobaculia bacterium]